MKTPLLGYDPTMKEWGTGWVHIRLLHHLEDRLYKRDRFTHAWQIFEQLEAMWQEWV